MIRKIQEDPFYIWRRDSWAAVGGKMPSGMSYIGKAYIIIGWEILEVIQGLWQKWYN
jgi:hypothetical protein